MGRALLFLLVSLGFGIGTLHAERTVHAFTVYCSGYPGDAGLINESVELDRTIVNHIFTEYVSPAAWGVKVRHVEVHGEAATKAGIEAEWKAFATGIGPDDTVYVHFSGHGVIRDRESGEQWLQTCDLEEFSRLRWSEEIDALPCRLKVLITDCCSSYPEGLVVAEGSADVIPWKNVYYLLMKHEGFVNITAASPGQEAYGATSGGFLTVNLESDMQRFRTWKEVFESTQQRVLEETEHVLREAGIDSPPQKPFAYSLGTPMLDLDESDAHVAESLEYIFEDSATRYLDEDEVEGYGIELLYLARNEIFARHGYDFGSAFLQDYFGDLSWYQRRPGFKNPSLSEIETANVNLLLKM
ncbi:MAG TPA: YARHG domain-containing protein, partial [Bacteroidia bacterium]|nr:YARHG domain-containing protein [Bacteroidia bacterium]